MAIDNLNFYSSWLPAWQLTDKYSSQPWCLKSKNLDIFSSSKSVKATAWSAPVNTDEGWVVLVDQTWNLILKSNWNVYDRSSWTEVLIKSGIATNFPVYEVSYDWEYGTYANAQRWTEKQLISKYENWTLKAFDIFTDRSRYSYSAESYKISMKENMVWTSEKWTVSSSGTTWHKSDNTKKTSIYYRLQDIKWLTNTTLTLRAWNSYPAAQWQLTLKRIQIQGCRFCYNAETEDMDAYYYPYPVEISITDQLDSQWTAVNYDIPLIPFPVNADEYGVEYQIVVELEVVPWTDENYTRSDGTLIIEASRYDDYYAYLPINENRYLQDIGEYYWDKWVSFQPLYAWTGEWTSRTTWERTVRYRLDKYMWWESDVSMDIIWLVAWNEQVYMIWNMNWNWYIIPCDLSGGRWTPYVVYWCQFQWVTNIDYLLYLVWKDRGISTLWVYNWQELVKILWWNRESDSIDLVWVDEQYNFDWKIINWRKNLILSTTDNRIFQYWQTYGGKGWTFINQLYSDVVITWLKTEWNNLIVTYSRTINDVTTNYSITYQDDTPIKHYNTEWEAVYPVAIWNHLLEKEETDLYVSYILPSADTSLEFWGMANHYHFWTFTSEDDYTFDSELSYKLKWATWDYELKFIERNGNQYTFRLEWDLPIQTTNNMKITDSEWVELINYSDFNHFRKIWEITTEEYQEWEFRFHNLNNKLELPKSHSLQIMVKGGGTANYTPELFALDLVANQRERW